MYRKPYYTKSTLKSVEVVEGETIETKVLRMMNNQEPITDAVQNIYTEKKDGVQAAYNIRTDRFEIAAEAMDVLTKTEIAKRENARKQIEDDKKQAEIDSQLEQAEKMKNAALEAARQIQKEKGESAA